MNAIIAEIEEIEEDQEAMTEMNVDLEEDIVDLDLMKEEVDIVEMILEEEMLEEIDIKMMENVSIV